MGDWKTNKIIQMLMTIMETAEDYNDCMDMIRDMILMLKECE
jgi:hypothetical protein